MINCAMKRIFYFRKGSDSKSNKENNKILWKHVNAAKQHEVCGNIIADIFSEITIIFPTNE